ncbi:hypothetical protein ACFOKF_25395 [Sphingobium rhizovicinum]|uniref:Uncharacterized protein n=1 Tax=Sphingobium rhizovicinum TaxID=432308 RepID=A0ABV7NNF5_9SPHN
MTGISADWDEVGDDLPPLPMRLDPGQQGDEAVDYAAQIDAQPQSQSS